MLASLPNSLTDRTLCWADLHHFIATAPRFSQCGGTLLRGIGPLKAILFS
jgi:hypothetical protein